MNKIMNLIGGGGYFVSVIVGLVLTMNIAIADPKEMPKYLNLEQFQRIVRSDTLDFSERAKYNWMYLINAPVFRRVISLFVYDSGDFFNKVECEDRVSSHGNYALFVKNSSEFEFVWQELSFISDCDLRDKIDKLQEINWKQFSKFSNSALKAMKRKGGWGDDSITMIITDSDFASGVEVFEEYFANCYENKEIHNKVPSTSFCVQKLSKQ